MFHLDREFYQLPLRFDAARLAEEVLQFSEDDWRAHPQGHAGNTALPLVAVDFPHFADGRGYSTARLLRERYGYVNELRAIGDVLRDQLFALAEVGFDAFLLREGTDGSVALAGFDDFGGVYAPTAARPQPWFRRRAAGSATTAAG
jgi:uncharacterized protein (DUF934 family)